MKKSTDQGIILTNSLIDNYFSELDTIAIFCGVNTGINDGAVNNGFFDTIIDLQKRHALPSLFLPRALRCSSGQWYLPDSQ